MKKRFQWLSYGIVYFRSSNFTFPSRFLVNGRYGNIQLITSTNQGLYYEFNQICLEDCYHLKSLKSRLGKVNTIVDIGANQGLFTLAARRHFHKASISCYEPNKQLKKVLDHNSGALNSKNYFEAVTKKDCKVQLHFGETDLHTTTIASRRGEINGVSLERVISRAGGEIDILKIDCEGGEWDLFEDIRSWKHIKSITMEYHLWARPGISKERLFEMLKQLNYTIIHNEALSSTYGLLTAIRNNQ